MPIENITNPLSGNALLTAEEMQNSALKSQAKESRELRNRNILRTATAVALFGGGSIALVAGLVLVYGAILATIPTLTMSTATTYKMILGQMLAGFGPLGIILSPLPIFLK